MIDIHSHILPGIDDGAESWDEAAGMAGKYLESGTYAVVATPHFIRGSAEIKKDVVLQSVRKINRLLQDRNLDLHVYPGMEVEICPELPKLVREDHILTINDGGKYLLVELPFFSMPPFTRQVFYELLLLGVTPVLAHPERNQIICRDSGEIRQLTDRGVKIQINAGSFLGHFGSRVKQTAFSLLKNGLVHLIGGDAHHAQGERGPCLHLVRPVVEKSVGAESVRLLFEDNPLALIQGRKVTSIEPEGQKTGWKSFWRNFL